MEVGAASRYYRQPVLLGALVAVIAIIAGAVDFALTADRVPDVPAPCEPPSTFCEEERSEEFEARIDRAIELEDGFEGRAWLYGIGALAAVLIGAGFAYARTSADRRRELFTDLGVVGVLWLIAGFAVSLFGVDGMIAIPTKPLFYPGIALIVIAAIGTLATPKPLPGVKPQRPPAVERAGVAVRVAGFALAGVCVAMAAVILAGRDDPCVATSAGWVEDLVAPGLIAAVGAIVCGIVVLTQRRWLSALLMIVPGPFAILVAGLSTGCWN